MARETYQYPQNLDARSGGGDILTFGEKVRFNFRFTAGLIENLVILRHLFTVSPLRVKVVATPIERVIAIARNIWQWVRVT